MLGKDSALERIPLFTAHPAYVQRIVNRNLVDALLQLATVDELNV